MSQFPCFLLFLCLLFNLSLQFQLFRDLSGSTIQNLQAQASQWTLSDPSGAQYPISISECNDHNILLKPATLPIGTSFKKTFDNLEDHNVLRFFVKFYYMGEYSSQNVSIKFDDISMETSQVFPIFDLFSCSPLPFAAQMDFYGIVEHSASSVTIEFSSNLNGTDIEINWGFRDFSLVPEFADIDEPYLIYAQNYYGENTGMFYPCWNGDYIDDEGDCQPCDDPCENCYGPGADKCFTYLSTAPEARLCPESQTLTLSGCSPCRENCTLCDKDVNKCDICFTTCAECDNSGDSPQCKECTLESNFALYQGDCLPSCPLGTYQNNNRECQYCQIGCAECSGPDECIECFSETTKTGDQCICNQDGTFFERDFGCTGNCILGCDNCIESQECLGCYAGLSVQSNGDCRCDNDGFYYQDGTGSCTGQCYEYCNYCHDLFSCIECSGHRVPQNGMCFCESPRILIGTTCECPAYMTENADTLICEYIDLIDIAFQPKVSPLFDAILQVQMNSLRKWTDPPEITWTADCAFKNLETKDLLQTYLSTQKTDILLIPSSFLEYKFQCTVSASFQNENGMKISKTITFRTLSSSQPQVHIVGGPFQMFEHIKLNHILVEVKSATGKILSSSDLQQIKWTQVTGDALDINSLFSSSKPFQLKIPKCTLSKEKIYKFKLSVTLKSNKKEASQEVTIGVYAPKIQTQISGSSDNYHLSSKSLTLKSHFFIEEDDECIQTHLLSDLIDQSTAMYAWEFFLLDLELSSNRVLLDETSQILDEPNVLIHPDPLKLFYHSTSSPTLTVPASYFTLYPGYQSIFYLTVTVQSKNPTPTITKFNLLQPPFYTPKNKTSLHIVTTPPFATPSITCINENNCQAYSHDFNTKFISTDPSFNPQYSYNWQIKDFDPYKSFLLSSYNTFFTIFTASDNWNTETILPILFIISDGNDNIASAFFALPWNNPPENGRINVYPKKGNAYKTVFFLSTYGWADTDLPVSYEFFTTYYGSRNMMLKTLNPYDETIVLPYPAPYYDFAYVGVLVKDNLKSISVATTTVELTGLPKSLCAAVEKSSQALISAKTSTNLFKRFRLIRMFMESMSAWEWFDSESSCVASDAEFKFTAISEMKDIFLALDSKESLRADFLNSIYTGSDPMWTHDNYWKLCMDIIDSIYYANSSTSLLPSGEYYSLMPIIDNLIWYMKKPESQLEDPDKIFIYINTLLRSTLPNLVPTDDAVYYMGSFYTYFTIKTTYCKVLEGKTTIYYGMDDLEANVTLRANQQIPPEKCNDQIDMIFMAFRPNYTVAEEDEDRAQSLFYFDLRDSKTGKSLLDLYTYVLTYPIDICPNEDDEEEGTCNPTPGGTEIYGIFDLKNQVNKIFAKSRFAQIQNISVLEDFKFWKSVAFWTVLAFSGFFLASFYWLFVKHPTYCALKASSINITQKSLFKKINLFFWVIHPFVGIYVYNDPKATKSTKLAIYYQRLVIVMLFSTIFSNIEKGEGQVFKTYILLFNTLTVTPINALFSRIFDKIFAPNTSNKKITSKLKLFIGIFLYLALLVGCFIIMFIIEAQQETSQNKDWAFNFIISFMQDNTLSPVISVTYKVFLLKLSQSDRFAKALNYPKLLALVIPDAFRTIYQTIFVKITIATTTNDNCQSPIITATSPVSSDRKLLRFSSVEFQSPTSSKDHSPSTTRGRRASETDMKTVNIMTTEELVGNRFQTFFSEAKPETVKDLSPRMKQNYPKMASSNLYSSSSSHIKLHQSVGGDLKGSLLRPQKLVTSIVMIDPAEINPEEIFSFEENAEIMSASQPKLWRDGKTMESPRNNKKLKTRSRSLSKRSENVG